MYSNRIAQFLPLAIIVLASFTLAQSNQARGILPFHIGIEENHDNSNVIGNNVQTSNGQAVINGHTLTDGVNTIDGQTYTKTKGFVIGPSITTGPNMQLSPQVTQAFGCMKTGNGVSMGDCSNVQSKIDKALASITSHSGTSSTSTSTSSTSTNHQARKLVSLFDSHKDSATSSVGVYSISLTAACLAIGLGMAIVM